VAVVSPDPANNSGGVERFCHTLADTVASLGGAADVVTVADLGKVAHDVAVTNGMLGRHTAAPRIHVYHGCWVDHVRLGSRTSSDSLPWKTRFLLTGAAKELWGGHHAYRIAVSDRTAAEVTRWYRYSVHRVIPNGIDTETFTVGDRAAARDSLGLAAEERLALFVGRAETRKRPDIAATAASRAGYRLLHAGSGSIAGASSLGTLTPAHLRSWINAADCVVAPSEYEGCSLAILEAMATGTAVVTTRVGYIPTIIDAVPDYAELTAVPGDVDEFTRALTLVPTKAATVAAVTAFVRAENSLDLFAQRWGSAIEAVLGQSRR
jgi:glycosyltransferase involved in cell wall biosynthesis